MASQMRRFSHAAVIWSFDVLSPQVDAKNRLSTVRNCKEVRLKVIFW